MAATKLMCKFRKLVRKMDPCPDGADLIARHDKFSTMVKEASDDFKWWFIEVWLYQYNYDGWIHVNSWSDARRWARKHRKDFARGTTMRSILDRAHRLGVI